MNGGFSILSAIVVVIACVAATVGCLWFLVTEGGGQTPWTIFVNAGVILKPRLMITGAIGLVTILLACAVAPDRRYSSQGVTTALLALSVAGALMGLFTAFGHWRIIEEVKMFYGIAPNRYVYAEALLAPAIGLLGASVGLTARAWILAARDRP